MADINPIKIFKGDDTDFNNSKFLSIKINTEMDLTGFKGIFKLGKFKTEQDMQSKTMEIVIPHEVTALMLNGTHNGIFTLIDTQNRFKTLSNTIPFLVTSEVFTQEEDSIDLPVPEGYPYEIIVELGGASDYNSLQNIPTFEGQPIKGNLTFQSTGIAPLESLDALVQVVNQKANTVDVQNACGKLQEQITTNKNDIAGLGDQTQEIESKIPSAASDTNQLADKQFVQDLTSALNFVQWVDVLPETGESKYIYAVPREETDTDGKQIAALYLWDGSAWRGAGAFSLNIDPATLATKSELAGYLPVASKAVANGVASLDANAKVPENQIPEDFIRSGDILLDVSAHSTANPRHIWQEKLDDCLYRAETRYTVNLTNFESSTNTAHLFDGNTDTCCSILAGNTGVVSISGNTNLGLGYPYGYIYCTFFYGCGPRDISDVTCRVYQNWQGHNIGWVTLTGQEVASSTLGGGIKSIDTLRFYTTKHGINQIEITLNNTKGTSTTEGTKMRLCAINFFATRTSIHSLPVLTKFGGDTIYGNVTIPVQLGSFKGNLTGTADKSVKDGDGNTISSTYVKVAQKGVANGVASLDTNGKVLVSQLPANTVQQISSTNLPNASTMAFQFAYLSDKSMLVFSNGVSWQEVVTTDLV